MQKSEPTAGNLLLSGVLGGLLVFLLELAGKGLPSAFLATLGAALLVSLGAATALWIWIVESARARLQLSGLAAAALRALAMTPLLVFASWRLFNGSYASTIINPQLARILCPVFGMVVLTLVFWAVFHERMIRPGRWARPIVLTFLLLVSHLASHSQLGRGYPDQLVASSALSVLSATLLCLCLLVARPRQGRERLLVALALSAGAVVALVVSVRAGASTSERRWELALHHGHARHWMGVARRALDKDGDGFSTFFGGGDCDDSKPSIHPSAGDVPDNGIDENCDGVDALSSAIDLPDQMGYDQQIAEWLGTEPVEQFLSKTREMDIVVIFIDTLRADLLSDTDLNRSQFPRIFALLDESRRFDWAFSPASGTDVAMASLLTGRINPFVRIKTTLFEAMAQSGRSIYAVFPGEVLRWAGNTLIRRGLTKLAEVATDRDEPDHGSHSASLETTRMGLKLLREHKADQPAFLWLHYFDVHEHLQLPSGTPSIVGLLSPSGDEVVDRIAKYRATLQLVDTSVGLLLDELRTQGKWDHTIVILASDHGESMLEDQRLPKAHGLFLYNALTHIPLAIRIPEVLPRHVKTPVALTDLTPTLTALSGAVGLQDTEAHTLLHHLIDDEDESVRGLRWPILQHEQNQWAIIDWPFKLLVRPQDNLKELFDLRRDFAEKRDLSFLNPEKVRALEHLRLQYPPFQVVRTMDIIRQREGLAEPP